MRPGPGLVVMALAFISGARRGSTSTSSKISSSTSSSSISSSPLSSPPSYSPSSTSEETQPSSGSILFPSFLGGGGVLTPIDSPTTHQRERTNAHPTNDYNHFYHNNYPPLSFVLPEHLRQPNYDDSRTRSESAVPPSASSLLRTSKETRKSRSISAGTADERSSDIVERAGGGSGKGISQSQIGALDDDAVDVDSNDSSASSAVEGLLVQFPSHSADSSTSFDEDDILALVAEDDLLSEESFDRLTQFTDDDKIGYINEEDYSGTEGVGAQSENSFSGGENQPQQQQQQDEESPIAVDPDSGLNGGGGGIDVGDDEGVYSANLVSNNDIAALAESAPTSEKAKSLSHTAEAESKRTVLRRSSIFESVAPLTRLNPWISACDLAQPGTAPDLQGQCSAGTLPVAWVDEGPGPPTCPKSCEQLRLNNKENIINFNIKTNDNNIKYLMNTNPINFKSNNNNKIVMTKVRRDVSDHRNTEAGSGQTTAAAGAATKTATTTSPATTTTAVPPKTMSTTTAQDATMQQDGFAAVINRQSQINNDIVKMSANHDNSLNNFNFIDNDLKYNHLRQDQSSNGNSNNNNKQYRSNSDELQQQQCLDYLGDNNETSPAHLCSLKSPSDLVARLRTLRLKHCCERNVFSALHTVALNATLSGGAECVRVLTDVMDLDSLATRITCEVAEILFRFDCRQMYSLIHQCDDCKEAYRRWVCSTLVPYFAEQGDVLAAPGNSNTANQNSSNNNITTTTNFTLNFTNDDVNNNNKKLNLIDNNKNNKLYNDNYKNKRTKRHNVSDNGNSNSSSNTSTTTLTASQMFKEAFENYNNNRNYATSSKRELDDDGRCIRKQKQQQQHQHQKQHHQRELHLDLQSKQQQHQQELTEQTQQQQQSNNFISTANSEDPCSEDPVIPKLLKRSKRKVEFRKRRRIRPCLNVCQTVEQKCPYLLPADRAPALPTQYAGEPTFLCLDQNIPETGEQLRRSGHGPTDCCYSYCYDDPRNGICTLCNEFAEAPAATAENFASSKPNVNSTTTQTRRVHNYTLTATTTKTDPQKQQRLGAVVANDTTHARSASVAIALKNATTTATTDEERLPFYAYYEGTYYYDDDTQDMPAVATSGDCPPVPSVTTRCTIPYYASSSSSAPAPPSTKPKTLSALIGQQLLLWLSAMLCLLSSYQAAAAATSQRRQHTKAPALLSAAPTKCRRCVSDCREIIAQNDDNIDKTTKLFTNATSTRQTTATTTTTTVVSCCRRSSSCVRSNSKRSHVSSESSRKCRKNKKKINKKKPVQKQNIYKFSKVHFSSKIKFYRSKNSSKFSTCTRNIITITSNNNANNNNNNNKHNNYNSCCNNNNKNYRFFYYYNFNINDWWRRWWIQRIRGGAALLS